MSKKKGKKNINSLRPKATGDDQQRGQHHDTHHGDIDPLKTCCIPVGIACITPDVPLSEDDNLGKMFCSSDKCVWNDQPGLIHRKCFEKVEEKGVIFLKSSKGRAREWSEKERLRYLWQDRAYELIFRMFSCPCGQGYLRKYQEVETVEAVQGGGELKKKKGLPKLNVAPSMLSQKGVGQYFNDPNCKQTTGGNPKKMRKLSESKNLLEKRDKRNPSTQDSNAKSIKRPSQIPGLMLEGPSKPQTLNIDLKSLEQPPPAPAPMPSSPRPRQESTSLETSLERDLESVIGNMINKEKEKKLVYLNKYKSLADDELFESDSDGEEEHCARGVEPEDKSLFYQLPELDEMSPVSSPPPAFQRAYRHPTELENVELLRQNISLRQENVALKQSIALDRKTFSASIQGYSDEIQRKNFELWQLYELQKKEENVKNLLREMILMEEPTKKRFGDSETQTEEDHTINQMKELDLFLQVTRKLESLKASAKSLSTSQNMAEGRMLQLDFEVKQLREENLKFRSYVEKFRSYFMLFDQF